MEKLKLLGYAIQKAREEKNISIEKLAKKVNISINRLILIEQGLDEEFNPYEGISIACALDTKLSTLMEEM